MIRYALPEGRAVQQRDFLHRTPLYTVGAPLTRGATNGWPVRARSIQTADCDDILPHFLKARSAAKLLELVER